MANKHLLERIAGIQQILMGVHATGASMSASSKGREREQFIDEFLKNALPPIYRFGTGDATDASGHRSGQLDVVVEYPFAPNIPLGAGNPTRLYLAEAVAAVVEVKSDVANQWEEAKHTALSIAPLKRDFGGVMVLGKPPPKHIPTYIVGYKGWKTLQTVRNKLAETASVAGILVIEDGLFCGRNGEATGPAALWAFISDLFTEITSLRSGAADPFAYITASPINGNSNLASSFNSGAPFGFNRP